MEKFVSDYKVGDDNGVPVVAPPPGSEVYLLARMWQWYPVLKLQKGVNYTLHLSSADVNHGFSLYPVNLNFQVVPGYDHVITIKPQAPGTYPIVCNEFCGVGHQNMVGKIIVQ